MIRDEPKRWPDKAVTSPVWSHGLAMDASKGARGPAEWLRAELAWRPHYMEVRPVGGRLGAVCVV